MTDGVTPDDVPVAFVVGDWFASPAALLDYILSEFNDNNGNLNEDVSWSFNVSGGDVGKFVFTWGGGHTMYFDEGADSGVFDYIGGATVASPGAPSPLTMLTAAEEIWFPVWPVAEFDRGSTSRTGYVDVGQDGTVYSCPAPVHQETFDITVNLDRADYDEIDAWLSLWRNRWRSGRYVSYYPDRDDFSSCTHTDTDDGLVLHALDLKAVSFQRLIRERDHTSTSGPHSFARRLPRPANATMTQAKYEV